MAWANTSVLKKWIICKNCAPFKSSYTKGALLRKMLLKIPQILQENTYFKEHLKKEYLPTTASCLLEAKYAWTITYYQLYISSMVLPKRSCFLCIARSFLFFFLKDSFKKIKTSLCFAVSLIPVFLLVFFLFENFNYSTQFFFELCLKNTTEILLK